jgi:hypothetical protein
MYQNVPGLGPENAGLTYSILAAISFKIVSLGMYTAIQSAYSCPQVQDFEFADVIQIQFFIV